VDAPAPADGAPALPLPLLDEAVLNPPEDSELDEDPPSAKAVAMTATATAATATPTMRVRRCAAMSNLPSSTASQTQSCPRWFRANRCGDL
jgi:hypothetical protein